MSVTTVATLIVVLACLFAAGGFARFGPSLQEIRSAGAIGLVVWGLVALAVADTVFGIYATVLRAAEFGDGSLADRVAYLGESFMTIIAMGGVLLGLAALLHVLTTRRERPR